MPVMIFKGNLRYGRRVEHTQIPAESPCSRAFNQSENRSI